MDNKFFELQELTVKPGNIFLYVPPVVWKGDSVGHIGERDLFFWVLEGECFLRIDSKSYIIRPGQLAILPKGKLRAYTHASQRFSMYEMSFEATANGANLMEMLGLTDDNYVVDIPDKNAMSLLFETSHRKELYKNPIYDVTWCANILSIIRIYAEERGKKAVSKDSVFKKALEYMAENLTESVRIKDLADLCYMQPTYFVKRFHEAVGMSPLAYFNRMRIYKAMELLSGTDLSIEEIARRTGISDTSYFSRVFKKHCNITPTEYRKEFSVRTK